MHPEFVNFNVTPSLILNQIYSNLKSFDYSWYSPEYSKSSLELILLFQSCLKITKIINSYLNVALIPLFLSFEIKFKFSNCFLPLAQNLNSKSNFDFLTRLQLSYQFINNLVLKKFILRKIMNYTERPKLQRAWDFLDQNKNFIRWFFF